MTPEVEHAIDEIELAFPGAEVTRAEDGEGGAYVVVADVALSKIELLSNVVDPALT